jgi:antitoxin component YwqK of YwqJK toxin-antitoxin module
MNKTLRPAFMILITLMFIGCSGNRSSKKEAASEIDSTQVRDTGYTGIKKYFSNDLLIKEVTFKNGVREGEMKSFYQGGQVYQSFWYENGLREDSAKWYYLEGPVFRSTPFMHDTIHGTQIQYYRNGRIKAKINYIKGLRTPTIEEYTSDGKLVKGYPDISYNITDNYSSSGRVRVNLGLTDKSAKVKFYRGDLTGGVFDTARCSLIKTINGVGSLDFKKSGTSQQESAGVIAEIITGFGNKYFAYKKIDLPYKDLK